MIEYLRSHRPGFFHTVDPFKVSESEACRKAEFLSEYSPFLIVGSTDCPSFSPTVPRFVRSLRKSFAGPLLTHFLPEEDTGKVPYCIETDAILLSSVLNSLAPHIRHPAISDAGIGMRLLRTAAIAFGADRKTAQYAMTCAVQPTPLVMGPLITEVVQGEYQALYLFSRNERLSAEFCKWVRERVPDDLILFVGGQVRSATQLSELVNAGADYVAIGSALEADDWQENAAGFCAWAKMEQSSQDRENVLILPP